uniref:uncharacterized protein LOC120332413 n=1 Tax=Styela clava TaxID=7725 RepID=UPI001939845C|nr:uncharacterized protein LOC120332413 [Styela clava]XP_039255595.1 uncharacterized protein LOC120332413 [Styela clava]
MNTPIPPPREKTPRKAKKSSTKSPKEIRQQDEAQSEEYISKTDSPQYNEIVSGILPVISRNIINAITLQLPAMIGQCLEENLEHSGNSDILTPITPNIQDILNDLGQSMREIRTELSEIKESQTFHTKMYDDLAERNKTLEKQTIENKKTIENLLERIYDLEDDLFYVSEKVEDQERRGRLENLEFHGIPVKQNEDTDEIVCNIAKMIGVDIKATDISVSHRMPTTGEETRSPAIIAKFVHRKNKIKIFEKRKFLRSMTPNTIFSNPSKIFIAENLTALNKDLYFRARAAKNNCGYKFIWTSNGRVFVKKNAEIKNSLNIRHEDDLSKIQ